MPYKIDNLLIYVFDCFLYTVEIYRSTKDIDGTFRVELMGNKIFETDKFLGFSKSSYSKDKKSNISFEKTVELLAAPIEFIKEQNSVWYEYKPKERKSKKNTVNKS